MWHGYVANLVIVLDLTSCRKESSDIWLCISSHFLPQSSFKHRQQLWKVKKCSLFTYMYKWWLGSACMHLNLTDFICQGWLVCLRESLRQASVHVVNCLKNLMINNYFFVICANKVNQSKTINCIFLMHTELQFPGCPSEYFTDTELQTCSKWILLLPRKRGERSSKCSTGRT